MLLHDVYPPDATVPDDPVASYPAIGGRIRNLPLATRPVDRIRTLLSAYICRLRLRLLLLDMRLLCTANFSARPRPRPSRRIGSDHLAS